MSNTNYNNYPIYDYINYNSKNLGQSSYGPQIAISYGIPTGNSFPGMYGPNLGPYPRGSGLQTGGLNNIKEIDYRKKYKKYKNKIRLLRAIIN